MTFPFSIATRTSTRLSRVSFLQSPQQSRPYSLARPLLASHNLHDPPKGQATRSPGRDAPSAPPVEETNLKSDRGSTFLGTTKRMPEFNLLDRVVLVSGGARGLGLTQCEAILEAGATVYALDRLPEPSPDFYRIQKRAAEELGTTLLYRQIDVRDEEMLGQVVSKIGDEHGRMDGLIAAAGIQQETPALDYSAKDANMMFEINITGVMMTSKMGLLCPAYNASKAGLIQLARNLASEWGEHGIRVNTISPGYIVTAMVEELFKKFPERREEWPKQNMLGKLSRPEDFRGAAVFLISEASRFMTGADLRIDGGHCAW
ncbi:MAG: hypothetical protein LQ340_007363 [Diploschistes diacapsis]|nr:MAG: hypothetical protein LQ340_007363 [Diploschistes diacapsis]